MLAQKTKERLRSNTLINVVETLEGHVTDIDLVNDKTIRGTVESVDLFMKYVDCNCLYDIYSMLIFYYAFYYHFSVTMKDATVTAVDVS